MAKTTAAAMLNEAVRNNSQLRMERDALLAQIDEARQAAEVEAISRRASFRMIESMEAKRRFRADSDRDTILALRREAKHRKAVSGIWIGILFCLMIPYGCLAAAGFCSWLIPGAFATCTVAVGMAGGWCQ